LNLSIDEKLSSIAHINEVSMIFNFENKLNKFYDFISIHEFNWTKL